MGRREDGELGGLCGYAKTKYDERVEERWKRSRAFQNKNIHSFARSKLHKPPLPPSLLVRTPRNRLRKSFVDSSIAQLNSESHWNDLFILEFDPYPQNTEARSYLGVYSTIDRVTSGAIKHGAYTFSREGFINGTEYLSPNGRIRIISLRITRSGVKVSIPERSRKPNGELIRLDIPHPESQQEAAGVDTMFDTEDTKLLVYLAIRQGAGSTSCIGLYSEKSLAWGACLKDKSLCACTYELRDEATSIGMHNMPHASARLIGSGKYAWSVEGHVVDSQV